MSLCVLGRPSASAEPVTADETSILRPIFSDDFSEDSLSEYQVKGEVTWEQGRVKLTQGASLSRSFEAGARVELVMGLEFPELTKDGEQSLTLLTLDLVGATDCVVGWQQTRTDGKTIGKVLILDTMVKDGKAGLKTVRSVSLSGTLASGDWWVEYRHGLLQVRHLQETVLAGSIKNGSATCSGTRWIQSRSACQLQNLNLRGGLRPAALSESAKQAAAVATKQNSELMQLYRERKFIEATRVGASILEIRKRVLGESHPDYATSLNNLAMLYRAQGHSGKAELLLREAHDIRKRVLGESHPDYAMSLYNLATLHHVQGESAKAEPLYREARDIRKRVLGESHPDYAVSLNNLAVLYRAQGKYEKAEPLYLEARDVLKRVLGESHPSYATSLANLAGLYRAQGESAKAEPLFLEAHDIFKRVLGESHPSYATSLNNLAEVYQAQGESGKAEPLYLEARDVLKRVLGESHPSYATSLANLAALYRAQGESGRAEPLYREARDIRKRLLGESHPDYAGSLNNLAMLYHDQGESAKAEPLYREARDIRKRVLGESHPDYAGSLNNLAMLYQAQGESAKAEPLLLEARDILKRVLGESHPSYAGSLSNLAALYHTQGASEKAETLLLEARDIYKRVLSVDHPLFALSLNNLAALYHAQGESGKAVPLYRETLLLSRQLIERNAAGQSQSTQLKYAATQRSRLDSWLSLGLESSGPGNALFDEILTWKGMTLMRQRQYRLAGDDEQTRPILASLTGVTRQLSALLRQTPTPKMQKAWREGVSLLSEQRDTLEANLAATSEEFRAAGQRLRTADLLDLLPEDAVLVDLLSFNFWQRVPKDDYHVLKSRRHFLASILRKGQPVQFVNLGPEADINAAVDQWRTVFLSRAPGDAAKVEPAGRELRRLVWEPLLRHLTDAKTILLSPDQSLGRVAFAALPGREPDTFLIEDYRLAYVPVPQLMPRLLQHASAKQRPQRNALLIGDVDYNADSLAAADAKDTLIRVPKAEELFENLTFTPLAETAGEVAAIRDLFLELQQTDADAVTLLQKQQATEGAFRQYAGQYQTLHIATHGFFADPSKKSAEQYAAEEQSRSRSGLFGMRDESMAHIRGFHPGMLSGLALAGANHAASGAGQDDGILTADETSFLRLEGVDLVVLSACETGLGAVAGGEGLLGVQRAFQVSGARSVVASLWNVDDIATRRLMERFYRNLWQKKMSRLDSLREAQLWMLNNPESIEGTIERGTLVRLKMPLKGTSPKPGKPTTRTDPRFWAAFTLSGDWR